MQTAGHASPYRLEWCTSELNLPSTVCFVAFSFNEPVTGVGSTQTARASSDITAGYGSTGTAGADSTLVAGYGSTQTAGSDSSLTAGYGRKRTSVGQGIRKIYRGREWRLSSPPRPAAYAARHEVLGGCGTW